MSKREIPAINTEDREEVILDFFILVPCIDGFAEAKLEVPLGLNVLVFNKEVRNFIGIQIFYSGARLMQAN